MSSQGEGETPPPNIKPGSPAKKNAGHDPRHSSNSIQHEPIAPTAEVNLVRRRLLLGGAVAGIGGVAAAAIHDGELGHPPQTFRGAVPWQEGTAGAPPGASRSGYVFFTPAEVEFIEAAVGRLIPNDPVGPGAVEANGPFFLVRHSPE